MSKSVLVVGCGVFGLSTALELVKKGYKVTAIDAYEPPSLWSAATDYNKIIRTEYSDMCYTKMSIEAVKLWRSDPMFEGIYNECGRCMVTPLSHDGRRKFEKKALELLNTLGEGLKVKFYEGGLGLAKDFEFLKYNSLADSSQTSFNPEAGLAHSANACAAVYRKCKLLGVEFQFGDSGRAIGVETVNGISKVRCQDGSTHTADQIIIACGASTANVLDLKNQQSATGLFVTHIKLTSKEYEFYKNIPILFDAEMGYFFPPDPETKLLKIALPGSGATNIIENPHKRGTTISLPRYKNLNPSDTMPLKCVKEAKQILAKYCPDLAYHDFIGSKTCWIADTQDSHFIIDKVPESNNLYVATGDSGHGFKFLPNIGKYIVSKLEGTLDKELDEFWKWKPATEGFDPFKCDWRIVSDFPDLKDINWTSDALSSKL
ncbi:hypothetical protein CANARDRAFT_72936 [[Candida] arabinofermentans NRRL YB-2248]|uniref:FAD dependent oxidoreductase domain-containing protein n=1 Tax=[Candida] arabinofermentans NRRL YB-2248 TaxID=983967 RepID=A0A1E4SWJ2_9ASCO|nr:hypothetical protein CANARDRAFT_72936 [[Candida] arabinofermentans NRRL YB-2248]